MASFSFNETTGTTLETIDALWSGSSTLLSTDGSGNLIETTFSGGPRVCLYAGTLATYQRSIATWKATSVALNESKAVVVHGSGAANNGYLAYCDATHVYLYDGTTYLGDATHGASPTTTDWKVEIISSDGGSGSKDVKVYVNDVLKITYNDATPLSGGGYGFQLANSAANTDSRLAEWSDGVSGGGGGSTVPLNVLYSVQLGFQAGR